MGDALDLFDPWDEPIMTLRHAKRRSIAGPKRIVDHSDAELEIAIATAVNKIPSFWTIMHGIDAYMERRKRRNRSDRILLSRAALDEEC